MKETLEALVTGRPMGTIIYQQDRLSFRYHEQWRRDETSFPLSLSMPLTSAEHKDAVVRAFIWGLLPDNEELLRRWGQTFQVSPGNPFRLLSHVGEECAGAVQFIPPEDAFQWQQGNAPEGIAWLNQKELVERIEDLVASQGLARRLGDRGQFSLAGAQPKTGLYREDETGHWGIPKGTTPTTHILKPATGTHEGYAQNEHFCLRLAKELGMAVAHSWTEMIGETPVIIVKRFDRLANPDDGNMVRVHQEDTCQSLGKPPGKKYESYGGPTAKQIFELIHSHSSDPRADRQRFLDALIYNWLIGGTDAHAKNYGFLLARKNQVRLAPLYDLSSVLPYSREIQFQKAKLAMKIGGEYKLAKVGPHQWEKAAKEWKLKHKEVVTRIVDLASALPPAAEKIASEMPTTPFLTQLVDCFRTRAKACLQEFAS